MTKLHKIAYDELNARQQEKYNFQKVAAVLADYGFNCIRLTDDWQGADFIAVHVDGSTFLKVQLKGRLSFNKKYFGKEIFIAFRDRDSWYLYPHDELQRIVFAVKSYGTTYSWVQRGGYSIGRLGPKLRELLEPYRLGAERSG